MPNGAFNICCPRDCVSRHNGGTAGAPLKPLRVDSALRALSTLRGLRGAPEVPPLCRETQSLGQQMLKLSEPGSRLVLVRAINKRSNKMRDFPRNGLQQPLPRTNQKPPHPFNSAFNWSPPTFSAQSCTESCGV